MYGRCVVGHHEVTSPCMVGVWLDITHIDLCPVYSEVTYTGMVDVVGDTTVGTVRAVVVVREE